TAVYVFWSVQLRAETDERTEVTPGDLAEIEGMQDGPVDDDEVYVGFDAAYERLMDWLRSKEPDRQCWNWAGSDMTAGWVARRMALETAIHRIDAEQAQKMASPIDTALALDGIDERIAVHLAVDVPDAPEASLQGSLCLVCSDADRAWVVEVGGGRLNWRNGRGPADAVLVGDSSSLFQFTWNRVGPDALSLTGRREVADAWATLPV
ncbi:MAG TPA: maleylpyruvate isomerase N-terminal domain-containing protein, partial [Acidimicrobiales bacterium]|nr:maleylpyruvate isomerase N-terminal domain-containing protein [Acidimicrobiales bacterium]